MIQFGFSGAEKGSGDDAYKSHLIYWLPSRLLYSTPPKVESILGKRLPGKCVRLCGTCDCDNHRVSGVLEAEQFGLP